MIDDFAKIYLELYNLNKRIYNMEETHLEEVGSKMIKIIKITSEYSGGNISIAFDNENEVISQYEKVVLELKLVGFPTDDYAVRLHMSSPDYEMPLAPEKDDYQLHNYMIPQSHDFNVFRLPLQKTLGDELSIGTANTCPFIIEVLNEEDSLESNALEIELYKSNTSQAYTVNDLTSMFIKINDLKSRQDKLEE